MTQTFGDAVLAEFRRLMAAEIDQSTSSIIVGLMDLERYKSETGVIRGLRKALDTLDIAISNIEKRN